MSRAVPGACLIAASLLCCPPVFSAEPQEAIPRSKSIPLRLSAPAGQLRVALSPPSLPFRFTEATHGAGSLRYVGDIPVFTLQGTPEQIGEQIAVLGKE